VPSQVPESGPGAPILFSWAENRKAEAGPSAPLNDAPLRMTPRVMRRVRRATRKEERGEKRQGRGFGKRD
jgi:hypothetical protein